MAALISFPNVPNNNLVPLFQLDWATPGTPGNETQQTLLIGNTVTVQPAVPVLVSSVGQAVALFGSGSILAQMCARYLQADPAGALWALPLADAPSTVKATGSISITGSPTANGIVSLYIGGIPIPVPVTAGMTNAQVASAIVAALNSSISLGPQNFLNGITPVVVASIDGSHAYQVDLTAVNGGTPGNSIDVRLNYYGPQNGESTPAGLTISITAMASGAGDPVITALDAILGNINYDFIAVPWSTAPQLNALQALMNNATGRWSYLRQIYGHVWAAKMDADATGGTNLAFGLTRNDPNCTVFSYEPCPMTPWEAAAGAMGACASSLRNDPARPVQTLQLPNGLLPPPATARYTRSVQQSLLAAGLALFNYTASGMVSVKRAVTTYQTNPWGVPDQSYRDTETLYALMYFVRTMKAAVLTAFPRAKLMDDGSSFGPGITFSPTGAPDQPIVTPSAAKAVLISTYSAMVGYVVEDVATFSAGLVVQRNANDASRLDTLLDPIMLSGLRTFAALVAFYLVDPAIGAQLNQPVHP